MEFDHIAVAGESLAAARARCEAALAVPFEEGGAHAYYGTHNAVLGLPEGHYVEAIAINPDAVPEHRPRWFDLDRFSGAPRVTNWICRCVDLEATLAALPDGFGAPVALSRGDLRWRMAVPADGILPFDNCAPALIQWEGGMHPSQRLKIAPLRFRALTIKHPEAEALAEILQPHLSDTRIHFEAGPRQILAAFETDGAVREIA